MAPAPSVRRRPPPTAIKSAAATCAVSKLVKVKPRKSVRTMVLAM